LERQHHRGLGCWPVTSITGTANQVIASAATGAVTLSTAAEYRDIQHSDFRFRNARRDDQSARSWDDQHGHALIDGASCLGSYTIPDAGGAANVMLDAGAYTVTGTWTGVTLVNPALGTPASGVLTNCTSLPAASITGTLGVTHGGTGLATFAQGDLIYGSASNTLSALAKDTNATRYLSNTGTQTTPLGRR
jgi:hypothetical protein